jgi:hypothetical protein
MKKILLLALAGASLVACTSKEVATNSNVERGLAGVDPARKYFIVQNIATERTRVYEKCEEHPTTRVCLNGTKNRLVFESEMVVGGDDLRSDVGLQNIGHWIKFYQDNGGKYPSWYDPNYPPTPTGGFKKWLKSSAMPNKQGEMRGAFGWYAAIMDPSATGQWMHGTVGWGEDEDHFIKVAHGKGVIGFFGKLFSDMRSHGCTRHENRAIAYLQSLLPAGSALIKIYAKEGLSDAALSRYESQKSPYIWQWILTKEDVRSKNPKSSTASEVQARGVSQDQILDEGTYSVDQYPTVQVITSKGAKTGKSGDSYSLFDNSPPQGLFLVDDGVVTSDYGHPSGIKVDGIQSSSAALRKLNSGALLPNYAIQP